MKPFLVLGIGNLLHCDDGAGIHAVNLLLDSGLLPDWVEAIDTGTCALDLPALVAGRERIIAIDTVKAPGPAGSVYRFPALYLTNATDSLFAVHEASLAGALAAVRALGERPQAEIVGIVPADVESMAAELTPAVKAALAEVVALVHSIIREYATTSSNTASAEGTTAR
jgi:hydrogenase maturation protease